RGWAAALLSSSGIRPLPARGRARARSAPRPAAAERAAPRCRAARPVVCAFGESFRQQFRSAVEVSGAGQQQCKAKACPFAAPTAQALVSDEAPTALSASSGPGSATGTLVQRRPFHCSMSEWSPEPVSKLPAAQALPCDVTFTPLRKSSAEDP